MSLLLHIETSGDNASVCLSAEEQVLKVMFNESRNDHAAWLHPAIAEIMTGHGPGLSELAAVSVSIGPGSYTGLRIGLSAAKGICYAMNIPLIAVSTLKMAASAVIQEAADLVCPMIDARRMEVFTAVYNRKLDEIIPPHALILDDSAFSELLQTRQVVFCGNGSPKLPKGVFNNINVSLSNKRADASYLAALAWEHFQKREFADTVYAEPAYIKEFYSVKRKE